MQMSENPLGRSQRIPITGEKFKYQISIEDQASRRDENPQVMVHTKRELRGSGAWGLGEHCVRWVE